MAVDSVIPCDCVTFKCDGSGLSALHNLLYTHQSSGKLSGALDEQMSIATLTLQCLVDVGPIVMHSPSVIEFKGSPFRDPIFGHIDGRVVVLFLYPPEELPEAKGCHLQPGGTRAQPAAVGHCGHAPVQEERRTLLRAEVLLLLLLTSLKNTSHALIYNDILCKSAMAEDVMLFLTFVYYNAI